MSEIVERGSGHSQARARQLTPTVTNFSQPLERKKSQKLEYVDLKRTICRTTSEDAICAQENSVYFGEMSVLFRMKVKSCCDPPRPIIPADTPLGTAALPFRCVWEGFVWILVD